MAALSAFMSMAPGAVPVAACVGVGVAVGTGLGAGVDSAVTTLLAVGFRLADTGAVAAGEADGPGSRAQACAGRPIAATAVTTTTATVLSREVCRIDRVVFGFMCLSGALTCSGKHAA
jgi:hypothetical protein